jgi:cellulose synthase/poly-beta-1,6-N-acetylglucosamine synthase-like glycosyltransferase
LERASIFAVGSGSFGLKTAITCTARNMVYRKSNWQKVGRFSKIGHIASGDDDLMLLLQRKEIRKYNFMFSQSSIVPAIEDKDLKAQMHQETRRGSKFKYYPLYLKFICLMTFIFYMGLLASFCIVIADFYYLPVFIGFLLIKIIPEFVLLTVFLSKVKRLKYLVMMPLAELIYIPYFVFFGLKGTFGGYKWKN